MKAIIAVEKNGGIGLNGYLPWKVNEDMQYFKKMTTGGTVIMGNRTWKSLPSKLKDRVNIVICSDAEHVIDREVICITNHVDFTIGYIALMDKKSWVIGGMTTLKSSIKYIDEIHLSRIDEEFLCNEYFDVSILDGFVCESTVQLSDKVTVEIYKRGEN